MEIFLEQAVNIQHYQSKTTKMHQENIVPFNSFKITYKNFFYSIFYVLEADLGEVEED